MFDSTHVYASGGQGGRGGNSKSSATASITSPILVKSSGDGSRFIKVKYDSEMSNMLFGSNNEPSYRTNCIIHESGYGEIKEETCTVVVVDVKQVVLYSDFMLVEVSNKNEYNQKRTLYSDGNPMTEWKNV